MTQIVDCPAEIRAEQHAYSRAMPKARKIVETAFPPVDMKVFAKYERARRDNCINIQLADGEVVRFTFRTDDAPTVPSGNGCSSRIYLADDRQSESIEEHLAAAKLLEEATEKKRNEYRAFIENATTFEQVVDVWPEAIQLAPRIKINLPANISPEMIARIRQDSAQRMKKKAA